MVGKKKNITIIVIVIVSIVIIGGVLTWGFLTNWGRKKVDEKQEQLDKAKEQLLKLHKELYFAKERVKITTKKVDLDTKVLEIKTKQLTEQIKKDKYMKENEKTLINNNLKKLAEIHKQKNDLKEKSEFDDSFIKKQKDIIKTLKSSINKLNEKNKEELEKIREQSKKLFGLNKSLKGAKQNYESAKENITQENKEIEEVHKAEEEKLSSALAKIMTFQKHIELINTEITELWDIYEEIEDNKNKSDIAITCIKNAQENKDTMPTSECRPFVDQWNTAKNIQNKQDIADKKQLDILNQYKTYLDTLKTKSPDTYKKICEKFNLCSTFLKKLPSPNKL